MEISLPVAGFEQALHVQQDGELGPEQLLDLLERDGPGDEVVEVGEQALRVGELEVDELEAVAALAPDALQEVLEEAEDAGVELGVVEGIDPHEDGPAAVEEAVLEGPALQDVEVDLVDVLQVLGQLQQPLVEDAPEHFLVLAQEHLPQRRLARGSHHYLEVQLEVRHAEGLPGVLEEKAQAVFEFLPADAAEVQGDGREE